MSNRNPNDTSEPKEYIFYISGEVIVTAYSEEGAEELFYDNLKELILEAKDKETIEIK
ncbi:MAG TPA: hypothetical protein VFC64_02745 [Atopostipes sp.]|nr:hypothetical protein [Atopostipes sp.]